ncbi:MAG: aspartate aminotransferase family protein [Microscillaceae bacterium]|jgi:acetylornithine/succinyldiaminopimelate/putrescine aminotransferase|nr:aspartate aminotransferase family protein [Microscillaceae bacterium]
MLSQRQLFLTHVAQTSPAPLLLEIARAEGVYLYSPEGKQYLDLISGIAVSSVGHSHPKVLQAVHNQVDKYMHLLVYGELVQTPQVQLARLLAQTLPPTLQSVYFTNSGTEATEGAMKLAKRFTRRAEIVACYEAYHGSTQGALSIGGGEQFKTNFRPLLPAIRQIKFGYLPDLEAISSQTAALIIETVQGEAGVRAADRDYFQALRARCTQHGALLILDECQSGLGRTGKMWAFEQYDIVPDIVLSAKALGGGMPLGAFISSKEIMNCLTENPVLGHITTFGGHPVSCAAGLASLEVVLQENLIAEVATKARLFQKLLIHPQIKALRNVGLLMAAEFADFGALKKVIDRAIELGVLTDWFLYCDKAMRIAPPLTITEAQIREACGVILQAIDDVL